MKKRNLINSHTVFFSTLIVAVLIMLLTYLTGMEDHRSLYQNSMITATILGIVFFCFIANGLYRGWKLKDTIGSFWNHFPKLKKPKRDYDLSQGGGFDGLEAVDGEGSLVKSVRIACIWSLFYVSWIYAIILGSHYFK